MNREKVLSVGIEDCETQTFRAGGKGGQNQNARDTGVRVLHKPSGARAESREHRTQLQNKRAAFVRMANSKEFRLWVRFMHAKFPPIDAIVEDQMKPENLLIEIRNNNEWKEFDKVVGNSYPGFRKDLDSLQE